MVSCLCPSTQHTDPTGCLITHDSELGEVCQICYKHHQADIVSLNIIPCRHRKIKIETSFDEDTGLPITSYYCRIHKDYLTQDEAEEGLLDQIPTLRVETANSWKPDTCNCKVEYAYDYDNADETKVYSRTIKSCPDHINLLGQAFLDAMNSENSRKNILRGDLLDTSQLGEDDPDSDGKRFRAGISYNWSFTGSDDTRVLHITISGISLTPPQKAALQSAADNKFGVGKIVFD